MSQSRAELQFGKLSKLCVRYPKTVGRLVVGDCPRQWQVVSTPADQINWVERPGDKGAWWRVVPSLYRAGIAISTPNTALMAAMEELGADRTKEVVPAVAFRVGTGAGALAVATEIPQRLQLKSSNQDVADNTTVIMGAGYHGPIVASGALKPETGEFLSIQQLPTVTDTQPLGELMSAYPISPIV